MAKQTPEEKRKQELIDELIKDYDGPESFWGESGLFADLKKRIVERTLDVEMDDHLGYSKHNPKGNNSGKSRNGRGKKTVVLGTDQVDITPPRDRNSSYDPQMDKATQANAANAEESASASEELSAQAEQMNTIVAELSALVGGSSRINTRSYNTAFKTSDHAFHQIAAGRAQGRPAKRIAR